MKIHQKDLDKFLKDDNDNKSDLENFLDKEVVAKKIKHFYEQEKKESKKMYANQDNKRKKSNY